MQQLNCGPVCFTIQRKITTKRILSGTIQSKPSKSTHRCTSSITSTTVSKNHFHDELGTTATPGGGWQSVLLVRRHPPGYFQRGAGDSRVEAGYHRGDRRRRVRCSLLLLLLLLLLSLRAVSVLLCCVLCSCWSRETFPGPEISTMVRTTVRTRVLTLIIIIIIIIIICCCCCCGSCVPATFRRACFGLSWKSPFWRSPWSCTTTRRTR